MLTIQIDNNKMMMMMTTTTSATIMIPMTTTTTTWGTSIISLTINCPNSLQIDNIRPLKDFYKLDMFLWSFRGPKMLALKKRWHQQLCLYFRFWVVTNILWLLIWPRRNLRFSCLKKEAKEKLESEPIPTPPLDSINNTIQVTCLCCLLYEKITHVSVNLCWPIYLSTSP